MKWPQVFLLAVVAAIFCLAWALREGPPQADVHVTSPGDPRTPSAAVHEPAPLARTEVPLVAHRQLRVVDPEGRAMVGAGIATPRGDLLGETDDGGIFASPRADALVVRAAGFRPAFVPAFEGIEANVQTVTLRRVRLLRVIAVDPWGEPVDGVAVTARPLRIAGRNTVQVAGEAMYVGEDCGLVPVRDTATTVHGLATLSRYVDGKILVGASKFGMVQCADGPQGDALYMPLPLDLQAGGAVVELRVTMRPIHAGVVCGVTASNADADYIDQFLGVSQRGPAASRVLPAHVPEHAAAASMIRDALRAAHGASAIRIMLVTPTGAAPRTDAMIEEVGVSTPGGVDATEMLTYVDLVKWRADSCTIVDMAELPAACKVRVQAPYEPRLVAENGSAEFAPLRSDAAERTFEFLVPPGAYGMVPSPGFVSQVELMQRVLARTDEVVAVTASGRVASIRIDVTTAREDASFVLVVRGGQTLRMPASKLPVTIPACPGEYDVQILDHSLTSLGSKKITVLDGQALSVALP